LRRKRRHDDVSRAAEAQITTEHATENGLGCEDVEASECPWYRRGAGVSCAPEWR